jgi:hypothetical protein
MDEGGLFDTANPKGWRLNGITGVNFAANGDSTKPNMWAETMHPKRSQVFLTTLQITPTCNFRWKSLRTKMG